MKVALGLASVLAVVCAASATQLPEGCQPPASLRETLHNNPSAKVFGETGAWFEAHGNSNCALASFEAAVQLDPRSARAHYKLGMAELQTQQLRAAAGEFRLALKYEPSMIAAHNALGSVLIDLGKHGDAETQFREALRLDSHSVPALVGLAMVRANQGDEAGAEKLLREAVDLDANEEKAHLNLALVLAKQQKFYEAQAQADRALKLAPQDPAALAAAGRIKARLGNRNEGVALLRKAVALAPQSPVLHLDLAMVLADSYEFADALAENTEAIRLDPGSAVAYLNRGRVLLDLGGKADAKPDFEQASQLAPQMPEPHYYLAIIEKQAGNFDRAAALLKRVVKLQPRNAMAWNLLGQCLESESQSQEAVAAWRKAIAIDSDNTQALWGLAKAIKSTNPEEAARLMARYSEVQNNRRIRDQAGVLANDALAAGSAHDWPEAIRKFQEAIEVCGDCFIKADLHKKLGLTLCQMGDLEKGEKELRLAQSLKPSDPDIENALERLATARAKQAAHPAQGKTN
jgi:tetratricopeptide (TPR) repeat protein